MTIRLPLPMTTREPPLIHWHVLGGVDAPDLHDVHYPTGFTLGHEREAAIAQTLEQRADMLAKSPDPTSLHNLRVAVQAAKGPVEAQVRTFLMAAPRPYDRHWQVLEVLIALGRSGHPAIGQAGGVHGEYLNGASLDVETFAPHILLLVDPGNPRRLLATALHEVGHYLRYALTGSLTQAPFFERVFDEGLCEVLVAQSLGADHVLHRERLPPVEHLETMRRLRHSLAADLEDQPPLTRQGYHLGYELITDLTTTHDLATLLTWTVPVVRAELQSWLDRTETQHVE